MKPSKERKYNHLMNWILGVVTGVLAFAMWNYSLLLYYVVFCPLALLWFLSINNFESK